MPLEERKERHLVNMENLRNNDIADWGIKFLSQLKEADSELSLFADFPLEESENATKRAAAARQRLQS
jgi:trehalose-6-phosphate synthase